MTALLQDHPPVLEAYRQYQRFNQDERLRAIDDAHQRYLLDIASDREEAREEGIAQKAVEVVRNMKLKGYPIADIAEVTGLSYTEVERLN